MFANTLLERLVVLLLRPCLPASIAATTHEGSFSNYLRQLLENKQEEAEEEGHTYNFVDPFHAQNIDEFEDLSSIDQVRTLSHLTTLRLGASDVPERLKDLDPDGMRVEPLGEDSDGVIFWYFYGVRLYKEVKGGKPKKPRKKKKEDKSIDETGDQGNSKQTKKSKKVEEEEEEASGPKELPGWYLACSTEAHWNDLAAKYKKSKRKQDKELYEVLMENFMPEISKMFQDKEKEERIKLMMMNKRSSNRLDRKRAEKEKEFDERRKEEERMELERRIEEEKAARREKKENKQKGRAERAKLREQMFLPVEVNSRLLPNRKRGREEERAGAELEGRRVRGSPREVVEGDHDYTRRREGDASQNQTSRRRERVGGNPALREWRRLTSASDEGDQGEGLVSNRNLRL